jgi:hypothetical protein
MRIVLVAFLLAACSTVEETPRSRSGHRGQTTATCGNDVAEGSEICDGTDLSNMTCAILGQGDGDLACDPDCGAFDLSGCGGGVIIPPGADCGDGVLDDGEVCEDDDMPLTLCSQLGLGTGVLGCQPQCDGYDTSACSAVGGQSCGNGIAEGTEECDGNDIEDTCESLGFAGGVLRCLSCELSTRDCVEDLCGNHVIDDGEVCDGPDLDGATCADYGLAGGTLSCQSDCRHVNVSGCEDGDALIVELRWSNTSAFPDLYLIKGSRDLCTGDVCSWENCTSTQTAPSWDSTLGWSAGDPLLTGYDAQQLSHTPVTGRIRAPVDGLYDVSVQVPVLGNTPQPDVSVTLSITAAGQTTAWSRTRVLGEGDLWDAAQVRFQSGVGAILETDAFYPEFSCDAPPEGCTQHGDCATGEYCTTNGECAAGCAGASDCPQGTACDSTHTCVDAPTAGWEQSCAVLACEAGLFCSWWSNTCVEWCMAPGTPCTDSTCCEYTGAAYCSYSIDIGLPIGFCSNTPPP